MKKNLKVLLMVLVLCGSMLSNITVKAEELEDVDVLVYTEEEKYEGVEEVVDDPSVNGAVLQSGDYKYVIVDGTVEITKYVGSSTEITIPGVIDGKKVTSIGEEAFYLCKKITKVTIPNSVTSIGRNAFMDCYSLKDIAIPNSVTILGKGSFAYCRSLTDIIIPNSVTIIDEDAFGACTNLVNITIPNSVTTISHGAFADCTSLVSITLPSSITSISAIMFSGCTSLKDIIIPSSVTKIWFNAFEYCTSLTSITIPNSVVNIGSNAFMNHPTNFIIYGNSGSYAESYASKEGITFKCGVTACKISLSETSYTYDGVAKTPTVTVKDGTKTLKNGTDYTVKYPSKSAIGNATVTITGKGKYGGTVTKTITIKKADYYNSTIHGGTWNGTNYVLGGLKMTNIFFSEGKYTYYLQADGTPMKNRLTYHPDGVHLIYFDDKGHELFDQFQYCADVGYTCYFDTFGYLYKDVITFSNGKAYYLDGTGRMKQNEYFKFDNGVDLGYAQADGSLINTGFGYDPSGNTVFYHWNGMMARGLITDGTWYYDMDVTDGHLIGQFAAN